MLVAAAFIRKREELAARFGQVRMRFNRLIEANVLSPEELAEWDAEREVLEREFGTMI